MKTKKFKCPHCKEKINYINTYRNVDQQGQTHLENFWFDKESVDENEIVEIVHNCPHCDKEINIDKL